jgi:DNA-binding transcriptional LysR family regulator
MAFDDRLREAFLAVVSHGSIGRAADALNVSQPTLSRMIKRLEQRVRVPLFDRYASGVALTVFGEALLPFARRIELDTHHALDELERLRSGSHGVLRVGTAVSPGVTFLPRILARLAAEHPELQVELMEAVSDTLEDALIDRTIDVAITSSIDESEDIQRLSLSFDDTGSVIASTTHHVRDRGPLTMADLTDVPWVMPPRGTVARKRFEEVIVESGARPPRVAVETRSSAMMKALVAEAGFLSWLPRPLYALEERADLIAPLNVAGMFVARRSYFYRRRHGLTPPAVMRLLEAARQIQD